MQCPKFIASILSRLREPINQLAKKLNFRGSVKMLKINPLFLSQQSLSSEKNSTGDMFTDSLMLYMIRIAKMLLSQVLMGVARAAS